MTLAETVLQKLAEWRCAEGRQTLNLPQAKAGWTVCLTADRADEIGCLVWELIVRRDPPAGVAVPLRSWAEPIAKRATGLLEGLKLLEVDEQRGEALLRSEEPARRGDELFYYELSLQKSGKAMLRRYHASRHGDGRREQTAFAVTHEALAKLADDLTN